MKCIELRKRGRKDCGYHPLARVKDCGFLKGETCMVETHNAAVKRAFEAGSNRQPLPTDLLPGNYHLPCES